MQTSPLIPVKVSNVFEHCQRSVTFLSISNCKWKISTIAISQDSLQLDWYPQHHIVCIYKNIQVLCMMVYGYANRGMYVRTYIHTYRMH